MPAPNAITPDKLARLVGSPGAPRILDLRPAAQDAIPGSHVVGADTPADRNGRLASNTIVVDGDGGATGVTLHLLGLVG